MNYDYKFFHSPDIDRGPSRGLLWGEKISMYLID